MAKLSIARKLIDRIKQELGITKSLEFRRLYPGYWQRRFGHWSWTIVGDGVDVGSQWSATRCVNAESLTWDGDTIYPE